jgi:hypothetical protein
VWLPISSTNTNRLPSSIPNAERHTNLSHSSPSLARSDLFSAVSEALDRPAGRSLAHPNGANSIEELAPLAVSSPGPSFDVFLKQQHGTLIQLRRLAQPPLWGKRAALVEPLRVTVDRRAVDPEPTGGLAFGNALLYGLYYFDAQIYGVGFHLPRMLADATSVQAAVELGLRGPEKEG